MDAGGALSLAWTDLRCNRADHRALTIEVLVLDEADRMLEMGFSEEVLGIVDHCSVTRQTLMLSATLGRKGLNGLARELMDEPQIITLSPIRAQHRGIRQQILLSDGHPAQAESDPVVAA
ncbi:MAG: DEAD/DEAH box helicase [Candidatus Sedimenticola endophacoides]